MALAYRVVGTLMQQNAAGYCSAPLLAHPLGWGRLLHAAAVLELAFSPPHLAYPLSARAVQGSSVDDGKQCLSSHRRRLVEALGALLLKALCTPSHIRRRPC